MKKHGNNDEKTDNTPDREELSQPAKREKEGGKKFNLFAVLGFLSSVVGAIFGITYAAGSHLFAEADPYVFSACFIFGIIFGSVGTARSKNCSSGKWFGIFGIIIGALGLLAFVGFFLVIVLIFTNIGKG